MPAVGVRAIEFTAKFTLQGPRSTRKLIRVGMTLPTTFHWLQGAGVAGFRLRFEVPKAQKREQEQSLGFGVSVGFGLKE